MNCVKCRYCGRPTEADSLFKLCAVHQTYFNQINQAIAEHNLRMQQTLELQKTKNVLARSGSDVSLAHALIETARSTETPPSQLFYWIHYHSGETFTAEQFRHWTQQQKTLTPTESTVSPREIVETAAQELLDLLNVSKPLAEPEYVLARALTMYFLHRRI